MENKDMPSNVTFGRLEPHELKSSMPIAVQALDNQWIPDKLLRKTLEPRKSIKDVDKPLKQAVRDEYIRALINGEQLVINRAYLYNSSAVNQDYMQSDGSDKKTEDRKAFKALLDAGVIVPYLYTEKSPIDPPAFDRDDQAFAAWQRLSREVHMQCVRLSWDDQNNQRLTQDYLARRFNEFASNARFGHPDIYAKDLRLDDSKRDGFVQRLLQLNEVSSAHFAKKGFVTRNDLYKEFITAGENPAERKYDASKPFVAEMKQLIDLAYNCNLPDALGSGRLLTPDDSLRRTALQELQTAMKGKQDKVSADQLIKLMSDVAFDKIQYKLGTGLKSMSLLRLQDVRDIRNTNEWFAYMQSLQGLLDAPLEFAQEDKGASAVYQTYGKLVDRMTEFAKRRSIQHAEERWMPIIELAIEVAGATLTAVWQPGGEVFYEIIGNIIGPVATKGASVVARLAIRGLAGNVVQADLNTSFDFLRQKMDGAKKEWTEIEKWVKKAPGFKEVHFGEKDIDATTNYNEEDA